MWSFGQRIKELRKAARLTQQELSEGIVTRAYISQIEKGLVQPSYDTLKQLAERLNCDLQDIFEEPEDTILMKSETKRKIRQAVSHIEMGQYFQAEKIVRALYSRYAEVHDDHDNGILKWVNGKLSEHKKNWEEASAHFLDSIQIFKNTMYVEELVRSQDSLGYVYLQMEKNTEAIDVLHEALHLMIQNFIGGTLRISVLLNLGIAHGKIGECYSAIRLLAMAREYNTINGTLYKDGQLLMALGICYRRLQKLQEAEECYQKALMYFKMINESENVAGTLTNLGILYGFLGQYEKALEFLQSACTSYQELGLNLRWINAKLEIANIQILSQQYDQAAAVCEEIVSEPNLGEFAGQAYKCLGDIAYQSGKYDQAIQQYMESLNCYRKQSRSFEEKDLLMKIADSYYAKEDYKQAAHYYNQSTRR